MWVSDEYTLEVVPMGSVFKSIFLSLLVTLMAGCKLAIIVVEGGEVQSEGSVACTAGSICIIDITDSGFSETFTAIPNTGWYFQKWNAGHGFFCGGSIDPACPLSFAGHEQSEQVASMVASDEVFYLMPVFKPISSTVSADGTVTIDGKEWLQPADFVGYSFDEVKVVCPTETCSGRLPGSTFDLTGYTWASIMEVSSLFNAYGVSPPFTKPFQAWVDDEASLVMSRDFEVTAKWCFGDCPVSFVLVIGMVRDQAPPGEAPYQPYAHLDNCAREDGAQGCGFSNTRGICSGGSDGDGDGDGDEPECGAQTPDKDIGVWFWRPAQY
jgi:hypothetical protein